MDIRPIGSSVPAGTGISERVAHGAGAPAATRTAAAPVEAPSSAVQQPASIPNMSELTQAVKNINKTLQERSQNLEFSVDTDMNKTIVRLVDQKTKEILRQIPCEEALEIAKAIDQALQGLLIKQQA